MISFLCSSNASNFLHLQKLSQLDQGQNIVWYLTSPPPPPPPPPHNNYFPFIFTWEDVLSYKNHIFYFLSIYDALILHY